MRGKVVPGSKGGLARARKLTASQRQKIARQGHRAWMKRTTKAQRKAQARKAIRARWDRTKKKA